MGRYLQELHSQLDLIKHQDPYKDTIQKANEYNKCLDLIHQEANIDATQKIMDFNYPYKMGLGSVFSYGERSDETPPFKKVEVTMNSVVSDIMRVVGEKKYG